MAEQYKYLFTPLDIGHITVKNRLVFLPHITGFVTSENLPDERQYWYFTERAKGGVGLIIGEGSQVVHKTGSIFNWVNGFDERVTPIWRRMTDSVHRHGAKIFCQLAHSGGELPGTPNLEPAWAPSAIPDPFGMMEIPKPMERSDIQELISSYAKVALRAKEAGYDGVELKASHDGILRQFWSPSTNFRQDEYGGSLDNRMRLSIEVLDAIRSAVGRDFVLGIRMCLDELKPGGYGLDEGVEIGKKLAATMLIDYLNTDVATLGLGLHITNPSMGVPPGSFVYAAATLRQEVNIPVITSGRINDPVQAEKILADGQADLVGMMRQLLCDPETPNKAREGKTEDIRHCTACNQKCLGGVISIFTRYVGCIHNPAAGREKDLGIGTLKKAEKVKKVMIVGGGPAGMKAAEIAARRGHYVTLYEKDSTLGGQIRFAEKAPTRADMGEVIHWLETQLNKLGVKILTNTAVTPDFISAQKPDVVILATGSRPVKPAEIPGADQDNVITAYDVATGIGKAGQKVLVYSNWGAQAALSVAEILADQKKQVEFVTPSFYVGQEIEMASLSPLHQRLAAEKKVVFTPCTAVVQIKDKTVTLLNVLSFQQEV
ncbi:MAG: FAD-dependent oxidoreductase, partial [Dehalococcoidia bacterium]|nr:FAD-dependent oxidoreductase [Dehalococcoidia bacterium]